MPADPRMLHEKRYPCFAEMRKLGMTHRKGWSKAVVAHHLVAADPQDRVRMAPQRCGNARSKFAGIRAQKHSEHAAVKAPRRRAVQRRLPGRIERGREAAQGVVLSKCAHRVHLRSIVDIRREPTAPQCTPPTLDRMTSSTMPASDRGI